MARRRAAARPRVIGGNASPRSPAFFSKNLPGFQKLFKSLLCQNSQISRNLRSALDDAAVASSSAACGTRGETSWAALSGAFAFAPRYFTVLRLVDFFPSDSHLRDYHLAFQTNERPQLARWPALDLGEPAERSYSPKPSPHRATVPRNAPYAPYSQLCRAQPSDAAAALHH